MELAHYLRLLRNWVWLILTAAFVAGGIGFILATRQVPYYSAQATLSIGQYIQDPNPTSAQINVGQNLVATYQQLVGTRDVLQGVIDSLKLSLTADQLSKLITTDTIENTSLLVIKVRYTDPILTSDIANAVAAQLITNSPTNLTADQKAQVDLANQQITQLTTQVDQQRETLAQLSQQIAASQSQTDIQSLKQQQSDLVNQINVATATIASFQATISSLQQRTNALDIVDRAVIPTTSSVTDSRSAIVFGALIGIVLAIGLILLIDYFDDKIRTTDFATQLLSLPVLGAIPRFGKRNASYRERLITNYESLSSVMEAYRRLRTNLVFMTDQASQKVFVVTSSGPGEGKSVTTSNLAATMAYAGMRVLLIDADMRRPIVHQIFGLENNVGLSTLLFVDPGQSGKDNTTSDRKTLRSLEQCLQVTEIPNLKVITSGFIPTNPSEILGSLLMKRWIEAFRMSANIDVILIDTPPVLMFADSAILAALVGADVLLVVDSEKTRRNAAVQAREHLQQVGADVKGVVVNRLNPRNDTGYYGNYYYQNYYTKEGDSKRGFLAGLLRRPVADPAAPKADRN